MSSAEALSDLSAAVVLTRAPRVSANVTLTKLDMIKF
jgi:hypothetical protein